MLGCAPAPAEPPSAGAGRKVGSASPPRAWLPLRNRSDFERVLREGSRRSSGPVTVVVAAGDPGPARVGLVVGKKVGNAVMRNRVKRRMREAVDRAGPPAGRHYVLIARPGAGQVAFDRLVVAVEEGVTEEA